MVAERFFLLLADHHRDRKPLDLLARLALFFFPLQFQRGEGLFLTFRLGPFLRELPLQLRELLLGQHRVLRGGGDFSPQVRSRPLSLDQTRRERVFFGRKFCTFGPERGEALFTRHQRRITRLQFVHQLVARRLLVGQGITQSGQEILLLGRNIRREFGHRCLLRPHWLRSLPTRQREEIEQQKITEDQQQGAVHDESLPSACDSMMSSRL